MIPISSTTLPVKKRVLISEYHSVFNQPLLQDVINAANAIFSYEPKPANPFLVCSVLTVLVFGFAL